MWLVLCLALCCATAPRAEASGGNHIAPPPLPNSGKRALSKSGLSIRVDHTWVGRRGYRPVKIEAYSPTPSPAERQVTVRLRFYGRNYRTPAITIEHDFTIPAGSSNAATEVSVPQLADWTLVGWDTWIDGRRDEELGLQRNMFNSIANNAGEVSVVTIGFRRGEQPLRELVRQVNNNQTDIANLTSLEAPTRWTDYSCADLVCTDIESLWAMRATPGALTALQRWVRSGGNLWVSNLGDRFEKLPELAHLLNAPDGAEWTPDQDLKVTRDWAKQHGWFAVPTRNQPRDRIESLIQLRSPMDWNTAVGEQATANRPGRAPAADAPADSWPYFVAQSYGTGVVAGFCGVRGDYLSSLRSRIQGALSGTGPTRRSSWVRSQDLAAMVSGSMLADRLYWEDRHGNDPAEGNIDFNNWLIPGYGEAPVIEFQLLITLFVIGIGPVNYYLLNRAKKLPMLLVTVPTAAAAATLLLFSYGLLSDGFSVRMRARSITLLDQPNGEAVSWSRLSYYAGLAPGDGLTFDADTLVYPVLPYTDRSLLSGGRNRVNSRELAWGTGKQRLTRGWLASRTPTQYLTVSSRSIDARLDIETSEESAEVANGLGSDVKLLVIQDEQNRLFMLEGLPAGKSMKAPLAGRVSVAMKLREVFSENDPQTPAGAIGREVGQQIGSRSYLGESILETEISAIVAPNARDYGGGTYIAITDEAVAKDPGLEGVRDSDSFHVVRGKWQ